MQEVTQMLQGLDWLWVFLTVLVMELTKIVAAIIIVKTPKLTKNQTEALTKVFSSNITLTLNK